MEEFKDFLKGFSLLILLFICLYMFFGILIAESGKWYRCVKKNPTKVNICD